MRSVVTIGGGTGQFTLLSGLKKYPLNLTAIVSMADDGGSTGVLRDELGVLPPGDIRQCLVALSESDQVVRELFNYRFDQGGLKGHSFGNIFLSALEKMTGSVEEAVRVAGLVLSIRGSVVPVTTASVALVSGTGEEIRGECAVAAGRVADPAALRLVPDPPANPRALVVIGAADCVVIGPGNFFCSILPNLLVRGIAESIARTNAKVVLNCNLMNWRGHTDGYGVDDYVAAVERYIGQGRIDYATYNVRTPQHDLLERYEKEGDPVAPPRSDSTSYVALGADILNPVAPSPRPNDPLRRPFIRHDPDALAALIVRHCLGGI